MAKKMQSFRIEDDYVENAQREFSKFGIDLNKSETVELALAVLSVVCHDIFAEKREHQTTEYYLRKRAVLAKVIERVTYNPETFEIAEKCIDDYHDYFWRNYCVKQN